MASIEFITAPIGGGKSLYGTMMICEELSKTDRFIVTNIPLILRVKNDAARMAQLCKLLSDTSPSSATRSKIKSLLAVLRLNSVPESDELTYWTLSEWCYKWVDRPIDVRKRLVCLTEEQSLEFWRYLPAGDIEPDVADSFGLVSFVNDHVDRPSNGYVLPNVSHAQFKTVPDFTFRQQHQRGVMYVLDECHQLFPARYWQGQGPQVERYMSQLRKLNDDLLLLTQHPEKVDKNFRRNATDWRQVENMSRKRMFMGVSLNNRFRFYWYNQAEMPTRYEKPTLSGWYRIDPSKRYHWLYKTAEGVGVAGGIVSEESRYKGRHPAWWGVAILIVIALAIFLPPVLQKTMSMLAGRFVRAGVMGIESGVTNSVLGSLAKIPGSVPGAVPAAGLYRITNNFPMPSGWRPYSGMAASATNAGMGIQSAPVGIYSTGFCLMDATNVWVVLSDGSIAKSEFGEVQAYGARYVRVFGWPEKIPVHAPPAESSVRSASLLDARRQASLDASRFPQ